MASQQTLTRADLAETLNRTIGLSRAESAQMVESILDHMSSALAEGENVKISGFGTFVLRDKTQRIGRNPKTGVEVPISPRRRSEEHTSELQSLMRISYAVFCLKKKTIDQYEYIRRRDTLRKKTT